LIYAVTERRGRGGKKRCVRERQGVGERESDAEIEW
jgi:hypothetical protein